MRREDTPSWPASGNQAEPDRSKPSMPTCPIFDPSGTWRKSFGEAHDRLDVLVNAAAVFTRKRVETADGFEIMFVTNFLGPFLLTNLLVPVLRAGAPSRVITISAPTTTELDFADLQGNTRWRPLHAFGASKMADLLFTYALARRPERTGVQATVIHPGVFKPDLMGDLAAPVRFVLRP